MNFEDQVGDVDVVLDTIGGDTRIAFGPFYGKWTLITTVRPAPQDVYILFGREIGRFIRCRANTFGVQCQSFIL